MATRLYPNTQNRHNIETLAGVPTGTYDRLDALEAKHAEEKAQPGYDEQEDGYRQYKEIHADKNIGELSSFLLYGWGSFRSVDGIGEDYSGCEDDLTRAARLLHHNYIDVDLSLTEGVHWC